MLGAFQVWGCQWLRGGAVGYEGGGVGRMVDENRSRCTRGVAASWADDHTQEFDHAPDESKVARNLGTLTFLRYRENVAIPTM